MGDKDGKECEHTLYMCPECPDSTSFLHGKSRLDVQNIVCSKYAPADYTRPALNAIARYNLRLENNWLGS